MKKQANTSELLAQLHSLRPFVLHSGMFICDLSRHSSPQLQHHPDFTEITWGLYAQVGGLIPLPQILTVLYSGTQAPCYRIITGIPNFEPRRERQGEMAVTLEFEKEVHKKGFIKEPVQPTGDRSIHPPAGSSIRKWIGCPKQTKPSLYK